MREIGKPTIFERSSMLASYWIAFIVWLWGVPPAAWRNARTIAGRSPLREARPDKDADKAFSVERVDFPIFNAHGFALTHRLVKGSSMQSRTRLVG